MTICLVQMVLFKPCKFPDISGSTAVQTLWFSPSFCQLSFREITSLGTLQAATMDHSHAWKLRDYHPAAMGALGIFIYMATISLNQI